MTIRPGQQETQLTAWLLALALCGLAVPAAGLSADDSKQPDTPGPPSPSQAAPTPRSVFGTIGSTPDVDRGNPVIAQGGPRAMQWALKVLF